MRGALLALAGVLAGCAAPPADRTDAPPRPTIVSLNPCADAILAEIAPERLLAVSHYSHDPRSSSMDPANARRWPATGGTVEEVLALAPDVVVASSFLAPATHAALTDLGLTVETVGIASTIDDSIAQVRQLAQLAGEREAGEAMVARIRASVRPDARAPVQLAALWQGGGIVPGGETLVSELMARAGLANHTAARGLAQASYLSLEQVLADPPDILLVAGREAGQSHPVLRQVDGTRTARFDPALVYCGGPTIPRAMARLRAVAAG